MEMKWERKKNTWVPEMNGVSWVLFRPSGWTCWGDIDVGGEIARQADVMMLVLIVTLRHVEVVGVGHTRTPESHLKGMFQHPIFVIRTFFQNFIRISGDTSKFLVLIRNTTHTSKKKIIDISVKKTVLKFLLLVFLFTGIIPFRYPAFKISGFTS